MEQNPQSKTAFAMSTLQKLAIIVIFLAFFAKSSAQIPIPIGSWQDFFYQSRHIQDSISHLAIKPYFSTLHHDTFAIQPVTEQHFLIEKSRLQGVSGFGAQLIYKKNRLSVRSDLIFGNGFKGNWPYPTMPFVGKTMPVGRLNLFVDPRVFANYKMRYIDFQAGRSKFHLGQSYRSLWYDSYAPAIPFVGANVNIWRVMYSWRIGYLQNPDLRQPGREFYHAFLITHYFDFSFGRLNINMFETVVQDPIDSLGAHRGFDFFNYVNPVVFYRAVDLSLGSPDNVLMGLGGSLRLWKTTVLYGYGVLDELIVSHLLAGDNCWCLKYGLNAGLKTFRLFGVKNLFFQAEGSLVRPYTYSHDNPILAYGNLYQPLAHPSGANFYEVLGRIKYFRRDFGISSEFFVSLYGEDIDSLDYGKDIFRSYFDRVGDFGIVIGQGKRQMMYYWNLFLSKKVFGSYWFKAGLGLKLIRSNSNKTYPFFYIALSRGIINFRNDWY